MPGRIVWMLVPKRRPDYVILPWIVPGLLAGFIGSKIVNGRGVVFCSELWWELSVRLSGAVVVLLVYHVFDAQVRSAEISRFILRWNSTEVRSGAFTIMKLRSFMPGLRNRQTQRT
jgi:uncharacterized membrane protein YeaQ/YmgE (transglycosylase-associated protein family)